MPAVDFVQGALIALDSLQAGDDYINATVYDTKSYTEPIAELIREKKLDSLQLIIGSVRDEDYIQLADFALNKNIPFISATYPNDGGITGNPFLVIMNSTLKAHCDAIYSYLLQNHGTDKIYLCRQPGAQEDRVASYFKRINEQDGKPLLPIETLNIENSNLNAAFLRSKLDSNRKSVIIGGSLDENFATALAKACFAIQKSYPLTLVGMPNWDNFSALFNKKEMADLPIYYTTTYYNDKSDGFSKALVAAYQKKYKSKPSDMAFKGYESVYLFTKKLAKNPDDFMSRINDKNTRIFCDYNFREVRMNEQSTVPDYFENKHLYLIKILNGTISKAW
jgi:ABC-type branched-subunit amino acid transport system substrate-binding protein